MNKASIIIFKIIIVLLVSVYALYCLGSYKEDYRNKYEAKHLFDIVSPENDYSLSVSNIWMNKAGANYGRFDEIALLDNTNRRVAVFYVSTELAGFDKDSFDVEWLDDSVKIHVIGTDYMWRVNYSAVAGRNISSPLAPKAFLMVAYFLTVVFILSFVCLVFVNRFRMINLLIIVITIAIWGGCMYFSERTASSIDCVIQQPIDQAIGDITINNGNIRLFERYFDKTGIHWSMPNGSDISIGVGVRGRIDDSEIEATCENDSLIITFSGDDHFTIELIRQ